MVVLVPAPVLPGLAGRSCGAGCDPEGGPNFTLSARPLVNKAPVAVYSSRAGIPDKYLKRCEHYQLIDSYSRLLERFPVGPVQALSAIMNPAEIEKTCVRSGMACAVRGLRAWLPEQGCELEALGQ